MEQRKKARVQETITGFIRRKLKDDKDSIENAITFLRALFLSTAVDALFYARRKTGLTQEQIARKLGKKQEAIARWEGDREGKMSLRQYFDLAVASGRIPLNITLEPIELVRDFIIEHPEEAPTPDLYYSWLRQKSEAIIQVSAGQTTTVTSSSPRVLMDMGGNTRTTNSIQQFLKKEKQKQSGYNSAQSVVSRNVTLSQPTVGTQPQA